MAIRKAVLEAMKRKPPNPSTRISFSFNVSILGFKVNNVGMVMKPIMQNGNMR
jgi:hypothetical protein